MTTTRLDLSSIPVSIDFRHVSGRKITMHVKNINEVNQLIVDMAKRGWVSGEEPRGGIILPIRMFPVTNFAALGFERSYLDQEKGKLMLVKHGQLYQSRSMSVDKKKNMPYKLSFSRGAKGYDDPSVVEESGEFKYVTTIQFKGGGRIMPELCIPGSIDQNNVVIKPFNTLPDTKEQAELEEAIKPYESKHIARVQERQQHSAAN